jgi:putative transcriptional regulator
MLKLFDEWLATGGAWLAAESSILDTKLNFIYIIGHGVRGEARVDHRIGGQDRGVSPGLSARVTATRVTNSIRALRFANGEMTQAELADRIGVTRQTIIAIEQGRYSPSLEMAFQIARVFRVPLDEVFQYAEGGPKP